MVVMRSVPHVLLVEDDPAVSDATRMLLTAGGCRVSTATGAHEAERIAADGGIDAVVTDYFIEGDCSGAQMVDRLRGQYGTLKAIMITGDPGAAARELRRDPNTRLLSKPVRAEEFLSVLHELLGG
jgi:DNA-binding NtrC family response regulator